MTSSLPFSSDSLIFPVLFPCILPTELLVGVDLMPGETIKKEDICYKCCTQRCVCSFKKCTSFPGVITRGISLILKRKKKKQYIHHVPACLSFLLRNSYITSYVNFQNETEVLSVKLSNVVE
jgi:hypothetical protein